MMSKFLSSLLLFSALTMSPADAAGVSPTGNKILVVLSSENKITLKEGITHPTGYFLSELMVAADELLKAGFELEFANPRGNAPAMDSVSDSAMWFGGDETEYRRIRALHDSLPGLKKPLRLAEVRAQDISQYAALFVPGGHAPMEDLTQDPDLGELLKAFHAARKPTALICHGPIALLSSLPQAARFVETVAAGAAPAADLTQDWIYAGYRMTAFSTKEEQQEESGQDNVLGGFVRFYPDEALGLAGGISVVRANKWNSHVVRDRELITAQNPMSDKEFARELLGALAEKSGKR